MIKKIIIMLFFAIAIIPAIYNMAFAQSYGSEPVDLPGGVRENWELISPNDEHWVLVEVYDPVNGTGNGTNDQIWDKDPENPLDPVNNEDWGYPDWADIIDWLDFLNESQDRYSFENVRGSDSTVRKYYIIVDNKQEKYYNNSKFNFPKKNRGRARFTIDEISSSIPEPGIRWKVNGRVSTNFNNRKTMWLPLDNKATYNIEVWEESIRKYIQFTVSVFGSPAVFFHRKDDYKGEYGFDGEGHQYDLLKNDYQKILVDSLNYNVPWMSLLDGQTASVKVSTVITPEAANDTSTWLEFRPSASGKVKINGSFTPLRKKGSELNSLQTIDISGTELDADYNLYKQDSIVVVNNIGNIIGKLMISCQKAKTKNISIIYVKTGTGYRTALTKDSILYYLNKTSHNQILKKWDLNITLSDTLDLTIEKQANRLNEFDSAKNYPQIYQRYYDRHKGGFVSDLNRDTITNQPLSYTSSQRNYILFVTDDVVKDSPRLIGICNGPSDDRGRVNAVMGMFSILFKTENVNIAYETIAHEVGHAINLEHTFFEPAQPPAIINGVTNFCPHIPENTTLNFMDYGNNGVLGKYFFYYQLLKSF